MLSGHNYSSLNRIMVIINTGVSLQPLPPPPPFKCVYIVLVICTCDEFSWSKSPSVLEFYHFQRSRFYSSRKRKSSLSLSPVNPRLSFTLPFDLAGPQRNSEISEASYAVSTHLYGSVPFWTKPVSWSGFKQLVSLPQVSFRVVF